MLRIAKWATPLVAFSLLFVLVGVKVKAEDKKETGTVSGTVKDADGNPVEKAKVRLFAAMEERKKDKEQANEGKEQEKPKAPDAGAAKHGTAVATGETDKEGKFTLSDVPVGDYTITGNLRGKGNAHDKVTVKAGETATVDLKLEMKKKPA